VPDGVPRKVMIMGDPQAVAAAVELVTNVMENGPAVIGSFGGGMGGGMGRGGFGGPGAGAGAGEQPFVSTRHDGWPRSRADWILVLVGRF
jgi:hypothetical protein